MSPLFHKKQYAFAHPKLVLGTLCCAFVCATIAFSAFHFGSEPPRVAFLSKPYGRAELLEIVSRVVEPVHPRQED